MVNSEVTVDVVVVVSVVNELLVSSKVNFENDDVMSLITVNIVEDEALVFK